MPGRPRLGRALPGAPPRSRQRAGRHEDGFRFDCRGAAARFRRRHIVTTVEIKQEFGEQVAHIVEGVTKISKIDFSSKEEAQAENLRKMMLAMVDDIRVVLIKLADRLHNMRTLEHLDPERQQKIAARRSKSTRPSRTVWAWQDSRRTGGSGFKYLDPIGFEQVRVAVESRRKEVKPLWRGWKACCATASKRQASPGASRAASSGYTASTRNCSGSALASTRFTTSTRCA